MNLSKSIKNRPLAYIAMKSKASPKKISMYKKIYSRIKNLELIDKDKYLAIHNDCNVQDMLTYIICIMELKMICLLNSHI